MDHVPLTWTCLIPVWGGSFFTWHYWILDIIRNPFHKRDLTVKKALKRCWSWTLKLRKQQNNNCHCDLLQAWRSLLFCCLIEKIYIFFLWKRLNRPNLRCTDRLSQGPKEASVIQEQWKSIFYPFVETEIEIATSFFYRHIFSFSLSCPEVESVGCHICILTRCVRCR